MSATQTDTTLLRAQIEANLDELYPVGGVDDRIIHGLQAGAYHERINAEDFGVILRHVVHTIFAQKRVAGFDVGIVHNVAKMNVTIKDNEIDIAFVVHVHKPIIAFLNFAYVLMNDPQDEAHIALKKGSLKVENKTRRFDLKAKTALKAMQTTKLAQNELSDLSVVIENTWPLHLQTLGHDGELTAVRLHVEEDVLCVFLEGSIKDMTAD